MRLSYAPRYSAPPVAAVPVVAAPETPSPLWVVLDVLLVFAVIAFDGAWPVPDVNEAHYLTKAKHYWQPEWCAKDPFLASADSHVTFFATFGYLTQIFPLPTAALVGRVLQWLLLAVAWRRLSFAVVPRIGWAAVTAAAMTAMTERLNLAGEWVVGGCEAKVVAFALLFSALADVIAGRWNWALVQLGAATLFHVLVGGWSLVALAFVWMTPGRHRPSFGQLLPGLAVAGLLAIAGVIPAWKLTRGVDAVVLADANFIYVQERLSHHLVPLQFDMLNGVRHIALWLFWIAVVYYLEGDAKLRIVRRFTFAAALLALIGLIIGFGFSDGAAKDRWLRFYWFRLSDVMPAVSLSLELAAAALWLQAEQMKGLGRLLFGVLVSLGAANLVGVGLQRAQSPQGRGENLAYDSNLETWRDACLWIKENASPDAIVIAPKQFYTFRWYAERADAGTWKDIPQDAASIVKWRSRLDELYGEQAWINFVPQEQIESYAKKYGVSHIVAYRDPPLAFPAVHQNNDFVVYELPLSNEAR